MSRTKKIVLGLIIVIAAVLSVGVWTLFWTGSTKAIEAEASKFHPPSAWMLVDEQVEPPRIVCLGGSVCPSLHKVWKTQELVQPSELQTRIHSAGWHIELGSGCPVAIDKKDRGQFICLAQGRDGQYSVQVSMSGTHDSIADTIVVLNIEAFR